RRKPGERPPAEVQAMNAVGRLAKFAAALIGRQPEDELLPRGFVGVELERVDGPDDGGAGVRVDGRAVATAAEARAAVASVRPGDVVGLTLRRPGDPEDKERTCDVTAGEGF